MTFWRLFSCWLLEWAERFYLHAHGWERKSERLGEYVPPDDYAFRRHASYVRSHAVNAQKQLTYNPKYGGPRQDPDVPSRSDPSTLSRYSPRRRDRDDPRWAPGDWQ